MTKPELKDFIKDKFKSLGYQSRKSYFYKIVDEDYLIGFFLDPTGRTKGYYFICGIIYLPDSIKMPINGLFDLEWKFIFPWEPTSEFDVEKCLDTKLYKKVFEYEAYNLEQLEIIFSKNYAYFIDRLLDKEYGLDLFRKNWNRMNRFSAHSVDKICKRAGLDTDSVLKYLKKI